MNWTIAILGYLAFGLLLMDFMCPGWHPFEKLIGAVIWPVSAVIGIRVMIKDSRDTRMDDTLLLLEMAMIVEATQPTKKNGEADGI